MTTLRNCCLATDSVSLARSNFIDSFTAAPSELLVVDSILDLELTDVEKAYLAATVDELCGVYGISRPDWIFDPQTYLDRPVFAADAVGALRVVLLHESPRWYRSRNLFVSANCSGRV